MKTLAIRCFWGICRLAILGLAFFSAFAMAQAQAFTVSGVVQVSNVSPHQKAPGNANVVVWLVPSNEPGSVVSAPSAPPRKKFTLVQKNKSFEPHVLVIPVGSEVAFPNKDPFFHNVFSYYEGKRFDLGLYESGSSRSLPFNRAGISYLFCNIHPEMSAVIIAVDTPYYAASDQAGQITIPHVPAGRYWMHVWKEGVGILKDLSRPVVIAADSTSLGKLIVPNNTSVPLAHKNKYGRNYEDPAPPGQVYDHP